jgi:hypothetical protein
VLSEQSHFWGAFGLYSLITLVSSVTPFISIYTSLLFKYSTLSYYRKMIHHNLWPRPSIFIYTSVLLSYLTAALFSEDDYERFMALSMVVT